MLVIFAEMSLWFISGLLEYIFTIVEKEFIFFYIFVIFHRPYGGSEILKTLCTGGLPCTNFNFFYLIQQSTDPSIFQDAEKKLYLSPSPSHSNMLSI